MKKIKTILASLMIILATAVISACSCSGSDDDGPQIPVTAISITSEYSRATLDEETGYLNITCGRYDEFDITYSLSPGNTTRTQVDWTFEGDDSVVVTKGNYYTYSNTATHTITFKAVKAGETIIKFKPKNTDKWKQASVKVGEAESLWPSFVAPSGLDYNPTTGKVVWNSVSQMKTYTGEIQNVSTNNGSISGLSGYILKYKNLTTGEEYCTPNNQPLVDREYELPRGYTYEISVSARGDDFSVKDSPMSESICIHQLTSATDLINNNGLISFSTPEYSELNEVYYSPIDQNKCITCTSDGTGVRTFNAELFDQNLKQYNIRIISYPKGWATAKSEGKNYVYDNALQARLYPSVSSETLVVQNLPSPTITFGHEQGLVTINGSTFGEVGSSSNPYTGTKIVWDINDSYDPKYGVTYHYKVTNNTSGNNWETVVSGTGTYFDTNTIQIPNKNPYMLTVWTEGNASNTINSTESTLIFYMPQAIDQAMTSITNCTTLTTADSSTYIKGVDLYFVDLDKTNGGDNSFYYFAPANIDVAITDKFVSTNISQLDELKSGRWDIYGRFVGFTFADSRTTYYSAVGPYSKINENTVIVSPAVSNRNVSLSGTGLLTFNKVSVNNGQTTKIGNYILTISQGNTSFAYEIIDADDNNSKISVNLYDIIKSNVDEDEYDEFTSSDNVIKATIVSAGIEGNGVNSHPSNEIKFRRTVEVNSSTIRLGEVEESEKKDGEEKGQKVLSFTTSNDNVGYTIEIDGYKFSTKFYAKGKTISINLETSEGSKTIGGTTYKKKLIECVNTTEPTDIAIWANGSYTNGISGSTILMDSLPVTASIECTETVSDVEIDADGVLKWEIDKVYSDTQDFVIYLTCEGNTVSVEVSASREVLTNDEEEEESVGTQFGKYYYNIFEDLSNFDSEKTISITIAHKMETRFTHQASEPYYIKQLASSTINKDLNAGNSPIIKFEAKANINYNLYVGEEKVSDIKTEGNTVIKKPVDEILNNDLKAGNYHIKLIASDPYKNAYNDGSESKPIIINSAQSDIEVVVVRKAIDVRPNGEYVEWSQLHQDATYTLQFKKAEESNWLSVTDDNGEIVFTNEDLRFDVSKIFEVGDYNVRIIPNINYMDNSVVLLGSTKDDTIITRIPSVTLATDGNGKLSYSAVSGEISEYDIVLYEGENILSKDEYTLSKTDRKIEILSSNYIGQKNYKIKIVANGYISSPLSSVYQATKLSTVSELSKSGDWLIFSTVEGADIYELTFVDAQGDTYKKSIRLVGNEIRFQSADSEWTSADASDAKLQDGKIWLNYNATYLGFQTKEYGMYYYSVTAQAKRNDYLNGNMSTKYSLVKLSDDVEITVSGESFLLTNYNYGDDELETPLTIEYAITYNENITKNYQKGSGWSDIVWHYDPSQFNENDIIEYELTFIKANNADQKVKLRLTPNGTNTPKLETENEEGEFVQNNYVTSDNSQYKITFPASEIEKVTFGEESSIEYADSITLSYIRQKDVYNQTVPFASAINAEDGTFNYSINLNDLELYDEGSYSLKVRFIGNGDNVLSSEIKESTNPVTKLAPNALFTEDGVLSWEANRSADNYTIRIVTDSNVQDVVAQSDEFPEDGDDEDDSNPTPTNEWLFEGYEYNGTNDSTYNISEADLKSLNSQFTGFEVGKTYYVQIMANANGCLSSKWSDTFEVEKLKAPTDVAITSTVKTIIKQDEQGDVTTTDIGSPMLTWKDSNNTSKRLNYIMKIGDGDNAIIQPVDNMTDEDMILSGQLLPTDLISGNYSVAVRVVGNTTTGTNKKGLLTSEYSTQNPTLKYVDESSTVGFGTKSSRFSWREVAGAYAYKLTFYAGSLSTRQEFAEETPVYATYSDKNEYEFTSSEFAGSGYFTVLVNAITDPTKAIVSTYVSEDESLESPKILTNCTSLYRANNVDNLMVYNGLLAWTIDMSDVRDFVLSSEATKNKMIELFSDGGTSIDDDQLITKVYDYISNKINVDGQGDLDNTSKDSILSHLLTFKANINGVETVLTPSVVDAVIKQGDSYAVASSTASASYLMYKFSMNTETETINDSNQSSLDNLINSTSKYTIKVAPQGNYSTTNSTVDGKYVDSITAYKPMTPRAVLKDADGEERKQISNGELWWTLVTTEDSTANDMKFHENYTITVVNNAKVAVGVENIDINNTALNGENKNLVDGSNYYRELKPLFKNRLETNTNYQVQLNVTGTPDSTKLNEGEKAYFNSNIFEYRDVLNILENQEQFVRNGVYSYVPCSNMSTETEVYVYGPFLDDDKEPIYAPDATDDSTWKWTDVLINGTKYSKSANTYEDAVVAWKELIAPIWNNAKQGGWTTLFNKYPFAEESTEEGGSSNSTARTTELNLTNELDKYDKRFGKGSYIIRKKEIGNGRGIIDTDYTDELMNGTDPIQLDYEQIATKLGKTSVTKTSGDIENDYDVWLEDGKFVWKRVERANAYKIKVEKLSISSNGVLSETPSAVTTATVIATANKNQYFEMPEDMTFNEGINDYKYRIIITATHQIKEGEIADNYFDGDDVTTESYYRTPVPTMLTIDDSGVISWNKNSGYSQIAGFEVMINKNLAGTETWETNYKSYDLSKVSASVFKFSVRSLGKCGSSSQYINSCYTSEITIVKISDPTIKVVKGGVEWGTETTEGTGEQITKTIFTLKEKQDTNFTVISGLNGIELNTTQGNYPLFSEIDGYDNDYLLSAEKFATNDYEYVVKYKGSESGEVVGGGTYVIASGQASMRVTKLESPKLNYVDVITETSSSDNRVKWSRIGNASGYRALVITDTDRIFDITQTFEDVVVDGNTQTQYSTKIYIKNGGVLENTLDDTNIRSEYHYFYFDNTDQSVQLSISEVINTMGLDTTNGLALKVYVQPIGTLDSSKMSSDSEKFVSGSFSDKQSIEIPAAPKNASYDSSTGLLSWNIDKNNGHNVRITMGYTVNSVSEDELKNYWQYTSNIYSDGNNSITVANANANRATIKCSSDIINRTIKYTKNNTGDTYTIKVTDIVFLSAIDGETPTTYRVTNTGRDYTFAIRILVGSDDESGTYAGKFMSDEVKVGSTSTSYTFYVFASGDGSTLLPYKINSSTMFNSIRYYTNANFEICNDISFLDDNDAYMEWKMIEKFTGSINGKGYTISDIKPVAEKAIRKVPITGTNGIIGYRQVDMLYSALIIENQGEIKDLNIEINNVYVGNPGSTTVWASGFVISNSGTIQNVHIQTFGNSQNNHIYIVPTDSGSGRWNTQVAGLAIENSGTIIECGVDSQGIYSLDHSEGNNKKSTYVAGLVSTNTGTIKDSYFSGNITGNFVGGLVYINNGTIESSYAIGTAKMTDAGAEPIGGKSLVVGKSAGVGGVSYEMGENATIDSCYSRLIIEVDIRAESTANSDTQAQIGGLVAIANTNATINNCYVVYQAYSIGKNAKMISYAVAPNVNNCKNNFYMSVTTTYMDGNESKTRENITVSASKVATEVTKLEEFCTSITNITKNGNAVYTMSVVVENGNDEPITYTYTYPVLISNPEKKK